MTKRAHIAAHIAAHIPAWTVAAGLLFLLVAPARAVELPDYSVNSDEWTGLSRFVELARSKGIDVEAVEELDYENLEPSRPVIIVYPAQPIDVRNMASYVIDGGRLLLADDFGESEAFLERLEIQRVVPSVDNLPHDRFVGDKSAFPIFRPGGRHPLLDGVSEVVGNHPSVITNVGGPVISYDGGGGFVYDMNLGDGKAIVIADASLLINRMLTVADNDQLALNALDYICRGTPDCRPLLLTQEFEQVGRFDDGSPIDLEGDVADNVEALNESIAEMMDALPGSALLYYLSILLVAGLAVYLGTVFPLRKTRAYSGYISDFFTAIPTPQSEFDWNLSRFGHGSRTMNYALPMSILKEIFEELFLRDLGEWPSKAGERPSVEELGEMFTERHLADRPPSERAKLRSQVVELLAVFAQIPPRHRVFLDSDAHFTEPDLLRYYGRAMKILEIMGLDDEYRRRTSDAL